MKPRYPFVASRTKDAFRPGEFTATIRTEQYRDLLRAEKAIMEKHRDPDKEHAAAEVRVTSYSAGIHHTRIRMPCIGRWHLTCQLHILPVEVRGHILLVEVPGILRAKDSHAVQSFSLAMLSLYVVTFTIKSSSCSQGRR